MKKEWEWLKEIKKLLLKKESTPDVLLGNWDKVLFSRHIRGIDDCINIFEERFKKEENRDPLT